MKLPWQIYAILALGTGPIMVIVSFIIGIPAREIGLELWNFLSGVGAVAYMDFVYSQG